MDDVELVNSGGYRQKGVNIRDVREQRERERENFELSGLWHRSLSNELHLESSRGQGESLLREKVTRLTFQVYAGLRTAL